MYAGKKLMLDLFCMILVTEVSLHASFYPNLNKVERTRSCFERLGMATAKGDFHKQFVLGATSTKT